MAAQPTGAGQRRGKRFAKIVFGFTLLAIGVALLVLPGPGWLTIVLGLAILAGEFVWAKRLLDRVKAAASRFRMWSCVLLCAVCVSMGLAQAPDKITLRGHPQTPHLYGPSAGDPVIVSSGDAAGSISDRTWPSRWARAGSPCSASM